MTFSAFPFCRALSASGESERLFVALNSTGAPPTQTASLPPSLRQRAGGDGQTMNLGKIIKKIILKKEERKSRDATRVVGSIPSTGRKALRGGGSGQVPGRGAGRPPQPAPVAEHRGEAAASGSRERGHGEAGERPGAPCRKKRPAGKVEVPLEERRLCLGCVYSR